jgi:integrase
MSADHPTPAGKPGKPAKPSPDFPLFPHRSGQWAKKIRGTTHYFGKDPAEALQKYQAQAEALHAGRTPRPEADPERLTIKALCNGYLNQKQAQLDQGELSPRTWLECKLAADLLVSSFGKQRLVDDLAADDFAKLRNQMAERWGPVRLGCVIQKIKGIFRHAFEAGLLDKPVRFGPGFAPPSARTMRLHRANRGPMMFEAEEVRRLLAAATPPLRAMILLGVNCGYGNSDVGTLPLTGLDLKGGWVTYHRPKTGISRRCPLWPETVQALLEALAGRPTPREPRAEGLVFTTKFGLAWAKAVKDNPVGKELKKVMRALGITGRRNFYCSRHSFATVAGEARDQVAVDYLMGHSRGDMASVYREKISDDRLRRVVNFVRDWLYAEPAAEPPATLPFTPPAVG